jgi:hypothetical protein
VRHGITDDVFAANERGTLLEKIGTGDMNGEGAVKYYFRVGDKSGALFRFSAGTVSSSAN